VPLDRRVADPLGREPCDDPSAAGDVDGGAVAGVDVNPACFRSLALPFGGSFFTAYDSARHEQVASRRELGASPLRQWPT
jgi:hypothetical protein